MFDVKPLQLIVEVVETMDEVLIITLAELLLVNMTMLNRKWRVVVNS